MRQIWNNLKRMWSNFEKNRKPTQRNWNEIKQCTKYWNTLSNVLGMQHVIMCLYYDMCSQNPGLHWLRYYIPIRGLLNQAFLGTRLGFEIQRPFETDSIYFLESHFYLTFYNFWSFLKTICSYNCCDSLFPRRERIWNFTFFLQQLTQKSNGQ